MDKVKSKTPKLRFPEFKMDWEIKIFKNIVKLQRGSSPRPIVKYITKSEDGVNWIKIGDAVNGKSYIDSTEERITKEGAKKSRRVKIGEIILSNSMSYGKPYILNIEGYIHDGWFVIREYEDNFNKQYLLQVLGSEWIQKQYSRLAAGGVVHNISSELVNSVKVNLPPKQEQQKIASFLTAVDDKIQQLTKKKEVLKKYKKGVMQKIFSQEIRFKDDNGNEYPDWEKKKLKTISIKKSSSISANTLEENTGDFIVYGASGALKKIDYYTEENNYIAIVKDGAGVGRTFLCEPKTSVLGTMDIIRPREKINLYFLYLLLNQIKMKKFITGSTIPHIYYKDYSTEKAKCPVLAEQNKIADFLSSIDKKIDSVNTQVEKTKEFKKGLLQQMFV